MQEENVIGKYLADRRKEQKLTLSEVASMLGVSAGYISRIERGSSTPTQDMVNKLCGAYGIDSIELLDGDGNVTQENIDTGADIIELINLGKVSYKGKSIEAIDRLHIAKFAITLLEINDADKKGYYLETIENLSKLVK